MKENFKGMFPNKDEKIEGAIVSNVPQKEVEFRHNPHATPEVAPELIADIHEKKKDIEALFTEFQSDTMRAQVEHPSILSPQAVITQQENKTAFNARKEERINRSGGGGKWFKRFMLAGGLFLAGAVGAKASGGEKDAKASDKGKPEIARVATSANEWSKAEFEKLKEEMKGENIKFPENYLPSTVEQRTNWNNFLRFLYENKMTGNKALDAKDRSLGLSYLKKYNELYPNAHVPPEFIPIAQFENKMMRLKKIMPFLNREKSNALTKIMPRFLGTAFSDEDNWLGSVTSTEYYPTVIQSGDSSCNQKYHFGTNYEAFLQFKNDTETGNIAKYAMFRESKTTPAADDLVKNK